MEGQCAVAPMSVKQVHERSAHAPRGPMQGFCSVPMHHKPLPRLVHAGARPGLSSATPVLSTPKNAAPAPLTLKLPVRSFVNSVSRSALLLMHHPALRVAQAKDKQGGCTTQGAH